MLMLPYSTELRLNSKPYVVYTVMLLCFIIFHFQQENRNEVSVVVDDYCLSIYEPKKEHDKYDYMRRDMESCAYYLTWMNDMSGVEDWLSFNKRRFGKVFTHDELEKYAVYEIEHYKNVVSLGVPKSLDARLMYYPNSFNPYKMITSGLSHADWSHIIFNLIFFFAFAPALEILVGSKLKFIGVLITIEVAGGVLYSIASIISDSNIPTLGLSGSVSGMIGLSAYMMPWARIRTLFIFFTYARNFSIPASILAAWYIGWDVFDLFSRTENGGVNVLAHVSGGLTGYALGFYFFKNEKDNAKHELAVEVDYMRSKRENFSGLASLFKGDRAYIDNKLREHDAKKAYGKYHSDLFRMVRTGETSEALSLLIDKYDLYEESPEIYVELFNAIGEWKKKHVYFCAGRLVVDLLVEKKKYGEIAGILKLCLEEDAGFILGDPDDLLLIVNYLISINEHNLAYKLIANAESKYGKYINTCDCILLEAKLLWEYLDNKPEALALLKKSIITASEKDKAKLTILFDLISRT